MTNMKEREAGTKDVTQGQEATGEPIPTENTMVEGISIGEVIHLQIESTGIVTNIEEIPTIRRAINIRNMFIKMMITGKVIFIYICC